MTCQKYQHLLQTHGKTIQSISEDTSNNKYMSDCTKASIHFDSVKDEYIKNLKVQTPPSCDLLH